MCDFEFGCGVVVFGVGCGFGIGVVGSCDYYGV